jgi:hypothetical protein
MVVTPSPYVQRFGMSNGLTLVGWAASVSPMTTTAASRPDAHPAEDTQAQRATDAHWFKVGLSDAFAGRPEHRRGGTWAPTYAQGYRQGRDEMAAAHPAAGTCRADDSDPAADIDVCVYAGETCGCADPTGETFVCPCGDTLCEDDATLNHIHFCGDYRAWVAA